MPKVRFNNDSTKSPKVPKTTTTNPNPSHSMRLSPDKFSPCDSIKYITEATIKTRIPPPILPSQLLAGDMRGKSLCFPKSDPVQ